MSKPRLHWISPLPPAQTDIAHYTKRILPDLCREADVTLWTDAASWDAGLEQYCSVRRFEPESLLPRLLHAQRSGAPGSIFAHIGNSWVFHSAILQLVLRMPAVIVLHDLALQEMYLGSIEAGRLDPETYRKGMREAYGEEGWFKSAHALSDDTNRVELSQAMPLFSLCLSRAQAVVTHTRATSRAVRKSCAVPVYDLELSCPSSSQASAERAGSGPIRLVQFGHTGPNRRLEQVLEALAEVQETLDFTFDIIGNLWDTAAIRRKRDAVGLTDRVFLHGHMPESVLNFALSRAHLVFNLRYPTMGEASGSQLRIWHAAAGSVVTDHGWYGDLPDDTVFKIPHESEKTALIELLTCLGSDRTIGRTKGQNGSVRLETLHAPDSYAAAIADIARNNVADAHHHALMTASNRLLDRFPATPRKLVRDRLAALMS